MRRSPMFTAAVVATVALAIAANTVIFSLVNAVLLRPMPFAEPGRLVQVAEKNATAKRFWGDADPIGRTLHRTADGRAFTVVGVVGDVRSTTLNQESAALYYP